LPAVLTGRNRGRGWDIFGVGWRIGIRGWDIFGVGWRIGISSTPKSTTDRGTPQATGGGGGRRGSVKEIQKGEVARSFE
jgi:hypothetical protein